MTATPCLWLSFQLLQSGRILCQESTCPFCCLIQTQNISGEAKCSSFITCRYQPRGWQWNALTFLCSQVLHLPTVPTEHTAEHHSWELLMGQVLAGASHTSVTEEQRDGLPRPYSPTHCGPPVLLKWQLHVSADTRAVLSPSPMPNISQHWVSALCTLHAVPIASAWHSAGLCMQFPASLPISQSLLAVEGGSSSTKHTDTEDSRHGSIKQSLGCAQTRATDTVRASQCNVDQNPRVSKH